MRSLLFGVLLAASISPAQAQLPLGETIERLFGPQDRIADPSERPATERILQGFVPDPERLQQMSGAEMARDYPGKTLKGIYFEQFLAEQRFVERFLPGQRTDYTDGEHRAQGRWGVFSDVICYAYEGVDDGGGEHCFRDFRYGDCIISYAAGLPLKDGVPLFPGAWNSVNRVVEDGFEWPEGPASEADAFTCKSLLS